MNRMKLKLFRSGFLPLLLSAILLLPAQSFAKESIYHFDFKKGAYFGEMYHVALALLADKEAYVYLPFLSEFKEVPSDEQLKNLEAIPEARQALNIYGFFKQIGLTTRIIRGNTLIPRTGYKVLGLIGKTKPDGSGKFFAPVVSPLADSTQAFERFVYGDPDETLKKAVLLFNRSGTDPPNEVKQFAQEEILNKRTDSKPLLAIWNRQDPSYQTERNMSQETLRTLLSESILRGYLPMILGPPVDPSWKDVHHLIKDGKVLNMTELWKKQLFDDWNTQVTRQLDLFRELKQHGHLVGQIGMKGGALDGPALAAGLPTIELVIPEDTINNGSKSRRILRFANAIGNMTVLEVDRAGSVRNPYNGTPVDWLKLITDSQSLRRSCKLLYEHLGLRIKNTK